MAVLADNRRAALHAEIMRECSRLGMPIPVLKTVLRTAINEADNWADANATEYNNALSQPFRGAASSKLKAMVLMYVIADRHEVTV